MLGVEDISSIRSSSGSGTWVQVWNFALPDPSAFVDARYV
jgi:hypothetical protein